MGHPETRTPQQITRKTALAWELSGIALIVLVGAFLHFGFALTGYWRPAGLIAAVNESTWEHFKIAFWPALLYALVEYRFLRGITHNFWVAKCAGLLTMPLVIAALFYGYTTVTGQHYLLADILIFVLAIVAGQLVSYRFLIAGEMRNRSVRQLAIVGIALLVIAFSTLSYYPPHNFLFQHPETGEYGILESYEGHDHEGGT